MAEVFAIDAWEMVNSNWPNVETTDAEGNAALEPIFLISEDETSAEITPEHAHLIGTVAIVTLYNATQTLPAPDGEGPELAIPTGIYLLNLPKMSEIIGDGKLAEYREELIKRDLLARARKTARLHSTDGKALLENRMSALLAVAGRTSSGGEEKAFKIMFPALQGIIITQVSKMAERLKGAKQFGKARALIATYSKDRLNQNNMRLCFASATTAEALFPAMPQEQWEALLKLAIKSAGSFTVRPIVKGEDGKNLKDDEGNVIRTAEKIALDASLFRRWLDTRNETVIAEDDDDMGAPVFEGLTLQPDAAA